MRRPRPIRTLARKELRELAPLLGALLALLALAVVTSAVLEPADGQDCAVLGWLDGEVDFWPAWFPVLLGFVAASMLLPTEHEQRTIQFLDGLPVTRRAVFFTKVAVAGAALLAFHLLDVLSDVGFCALNPDTMERRKLDPPLIALRAGLDGAHVLIGLAHGTLLAFLRRLGWVVLVGVMIALQAAKAAWAPLALLDLTALHQVEHYGEAPLIPWRAWLVHGALGAASFAAAGRLWLSRPERFAAVQQEIATRGWLRRSGLALGLGAAVLLSATMGGGLRWGGSDDDGEDESVEDGPTATIETKHFHFTYRRGDEQQARFVASIADEAYQRVKQQLRAPELPRVIADLTRRTNDHAGMAGWQRMRLDIRSRSDEPYLRYVLHHELVHVVATAVGGAIPQGRDRVLRLFDEGLADHVSFQLLAPQTDRALAHSRALAAYWRKQYQIDFSALQDPGAFLLRHAEVGLYVLGEVWVDALVRTCGPDLPGRLLRRFGDPSLPRDLTGSALWRVALQREGCPFEAARSRYEGELARRWPEAQRLPIATARYLGRNPDGGLDFEIRVEVGPDAGPGPLQAILVLRDGPHTPAHLFARQAMELVPQAPATVTMRTFHLEGDRFEFMVGASPTQDTHPLFTRWQSTSAGNSAGK